MIMTDLHARKIVCIIYWILIIFGIITARLFYLQILLAPALQQKSHHNYVRIELTPSRRGNILDRYGILLATNTPGTDLYWKVQNATSLTTAHLTTLHMLSSILDTPFTDEYMLQKIQTAMLTGAPFALAHDVSFEQLSKIAEQCGTCPCINFQNHFKRFYPFSTYACHVIGYLGNITVDPAGKMGLEELCEQTLKGTKGTLIKKINSHGTAVTEIELSPAATGTTLVTTLDMQIQTIAENTFPLSLTGTCIIMNPIDGAILALLSRPSFDPSIFLKPIASTTWSTLQEGSPFINRAVNPYPPGSIFKLVTMSAALEHNIIDAEKQIYCRGYYTFAHRRYWCNKRLGHGHLSTTHAIGKSCNIVFFDIGKQIDIDLLAHYASLFGLGQKSGFMFPEHTGLVPSRSWKQTAKGERWWPGETLSAAIGQSFLLVTPVQVARMIGAIFTGYLVNPRILLNEPVVVQKLLIKDETLAFLKKSMKAVIKKGTAKRLKALSHDLEIYAKTSTAQIVSLSKGSIDRAHQEHGWFVAHFQYKQESPLVLVMLVEHAGTSQVATSIAKDFLIEYKKYVDEKILNMAKVM
ncbi:MAG TPA: penicillin-binding transpeptidase domain-containing protein [Candidatus Bathyarchaeia archaeon]|nr:penicillin-binding transpeptidase domain-containing protein [Candidatus Bathyarchaeia archaeon]